jgi:uncharacterized protein with NRDE domain
MCLIAWRWLPDSATPLTWAANRDEFAHRPSAMLQHWQVPNQHSTALPRHRVLGGLDLALEPRHQIYGTWAGVSAAGKFAWLTNIRNPKYANPQAPSRGLLVSQFLASNDSVQTYVGAVQAKAHRYNGFNLVLGQIGTGLQTASCMHFNSASGKVTSLGAGVYGLSNDDLDSPWPKTRALVQAVSMNAAAQFAGQLNTASLFTALANTQRCAGEDLPTTGVPIEIEHLLSSAFIASKIRGNDYGTRSSTVGWVHDGFFEVHERSFNAQGLCDNTAFEQLSIITE